MNKIAASIMCANQLDLQNELRLLEQANVDLLHCDVMDGMYVNNLAMGPYVLEAIKDATSIPLDIHLATQDPAHYIEMFAPIQPKYMSFHIEATRDVAKDIALLQKHEIIPVLAVNPETPVETIFPYLGEIGMVLMMTVNPGFAGQRFNASVLEKITTLTTELDKRNHQVLIEVDGNINEKTIPPLVERGADVYVLGTSQLFNEKAGTYYDKVNKVAEIIKIKE